MTSEHRAIAVQAGARRRHPLRAPRRAARADRGVEPADAADEGHRQPCRGFGSAVSVELDAPGVLRELVQDAIDRHFAPGEIDVLKAAEESERDAIARLVTKVEAGGDDRIRLCERQRGSVAGRGRGPGPEATSSRTLARIIRGFSTLLQAGEGIGCLAARTGDEDPGVSVPVRWFPGVSLPRTYEPEENQRAPGPRRQLQIRT